MVDVRGRGASWLPLLLARQALPEKTLMSRNVTWEIRQGDALERLREMPDESVQCCVTSPPYFGLRDYGSDGQIGLEAAPDEYVAKLVEVFREVHRALRTDGTLWLNIGDSYNASAAGNKTPSGFSQTRPSRISGNGDQETVKTGRGIVRGCKPKDLLGIPWQLAVALRADGWYLRSDIIWAKPNPMPESVTDRPSSAHEHVFLLAKSTRYFYDADAIREPAEYDGPNGAQHSPYGQGFTRRSPEEEQARRERRGKALTSPRKDGDAWNENNGRGFIPSAPGRNKRNVWEIATQPYPEAHFATFPAKLVKPCVLAGSAAGDMVLDPFAGSGTTGLVALRHCRAFVGIELSPDYCELARRRIRDDAPLWNIPAEVAA